MKEKKIVIAGSQGERGEASEVLSIPVNGVVGYINEGTPQGFVSAIEPKNITEPLKVVDSRLYVLEHLPSGATTGDAETADMRVSYDGQRYDSAGEAVRAQISDLHSYAEEEDEIQDDNIATMIVKGEVEGDYITIDDAAPLPANSYSLTLSPVQDLNGYEYPWAAGAGKNKSTVTSGDIKAGDLVTFSTPLPSGTYSLSFNATRTGSTSDEASVIVYDSNDNPYTAKSVIPNTGNRVKIENNTYNNGVSRIYFFSIAGSWGQSQNYTLSITDFQIEQSASATDFAPYSNICPIHGADEVGVRVCGKNLCKYWKNAYINGSHDIVNNNDNVMCSPIRLLANKSYTISKGTTGTYGYCVYADKDFTQTIAYNGSVGNPTTLSYNTDCYLIAWFNVGGGSGSQATFDAKQPQIEIGSTATPYEPYTATDTTITLPSTVYGGSVEQGGSGKVTKAIYTIPTITEIRQSGDNKFVYINIPSIKSVTGVTDDIVCDRLGFVSVVGDYFGLYHISGTIVVSLPQNYTVEEYNAQIAGGEIVYPLATPETLSLTPFPQTLLEGVNNLWAEMSEDGSVIGNADQSLKYQRDTTNIINSLINRIEELERRNV